MKRLKSKIASRLKSRAGETIAEVLIALLIAALAMTMLASAITSATKIITQSKAKMESYYGKNEALASHVGSKDGTVSFSVGGSVKFLTSGNSLTVKYASNSEVANEPVISYWYSVPTPTTPPDGEGE